MAEELPINYVKYKGEKFLPITSTKAVINENGVSVEDLLLQDGNVYEFAKNEMDKTLNLIEGISTTNEYITDAGGTGSSTSSLLTYYVSIDSSKGSLVFDAEGTFDYGERSVVFFDENYIYIKGKSYNTPKTYFTIPSNAKYFRIAYCKTLSKVSVSYMGEIMYEIDIKPILLWKNGNDNVAFSKQDITVLNLSAYSKIQIYYGVYCNGLGKMSQYDITLGSHKESQLAGVSSNGALPIQRNFTISTENNTISFNNAFQSGNMANDFLVPKEIYGLK